MKLQITYCNEWNYLPKASRVEQELKTTHPDVNVQLIPGQGGIFDVVADGTLIFSKRITGRFPENDEISKLIQSAT